MTIGVLQVSLHFPAPQSLKEKRMILKSLTDRLRKQFNIAICEIDGMDAWQRSVLALAAIAGETSRANQILSHSLEFIRQERDVEITKEHLEFF